MKKISLLISVLIISFFGISQTNSGQHKNHEVQFPDGKEAGKIQKKANDFAYCLQLNKLNSSKQMTYSATETKQQLDSINSEYWTFDSEDWINWHKAEYLYNETGLTIEYDHFFFDEILETWDTATKIFYEYDENRNMKKSFSINWNSVDSIWEDNHYSTYGYNSKNQLSNYIYTTWNDMTEEWVDVYKIEYHYNADDLLELIYDYSGLHDSVEWKLGEKVEYTYDMDNNLTQIVASNLIDDEENWQAYFQQLLSYELDENVSSIISQDWDKNKNDWDNYDKEEYEYDSNGNNTIAYEFSWSEAGSTWRENFKANNTFDLSYDYNELILPGHNFFPYNNLDEIHTNVNMFTGSTRQVFGQNGWENWSKNTYYYSEQEVSGIAYLNSNDFAVYPNPADGYIFIENKNGTVQAIVEIFSLSGKKLLNQQINGVEKVDISHMNSGIYIYKIKSNKEVISGKLIVK